MSMLKDCPQFAARIICHIFNNMIRTNIYPQAFKTSKIIPIHKSGKDPTSINSYRPICILPTVDKVIQTILRSQMEQHFEDNDLISKEHHGGRKNHSTVTALASIDLNHKKLKEKNNTVAIMTTDMSSAFDLVNHKVLIKKLKFYGVDNIASEQ